VTEQMWLVSRTYTERRRRRVDRFVVFCSDGATAIRLVQSTGHGYALPTERDIEWNAETYSTPDDRIVALPRTMHVTRK